MNILIEIDKLPRGSRIAIAAEIIKRNQPTPYELAYAGGINLHSLYSWLGLNPNNPNEIQTAKHG